MRAPIATCFSLLPELLVDQAFHCDFASFPTPDGEQMLAFWVRVAKVEAEDGQPTTGDGRAFGHEVVAYPCDCNGRVLDWERRYEVTTTQGGCAVLSKLRLMMANGIAALCNYEGFLEEFGKHETEKFDWDEMPNL